MAKELYFELYEGGSLTKNTFDVYLDSAENGRVPIFGGSSGLAGAVENSYYYDGATYTSSHLTGTNGFSAWGGTSLVLAIYYYRIRILYQGSLRFCSAWFELSNNGYADYLPYYGTNGPSNGIYRIPVASNTLGPSRILSGTTALPNLPSIKKTIPCDIYLFWSNGGSYLSGGGDIPTYCWNYYCQHW